MAFSQGGIELPALGGMKNHHFGHPSRTGEELGSFNAA
jgi:hypothetical protein